MITPKQRAFLKKEAHGMTPTVLIGKGGISDELIRQVNEQLEKENSSRENAWTPRRCRRRKRRKSC